VTLEDLVARAASEGWPIRPPTIGPRPIVDRGDAVGFYCPHPAGRGRTRVGPIYVAPEHRGRGLALQAYAWATADTPLVAYVHASNTASLRLHQRAGFRLWYASRGGSYWKRP
jgi:RimJ/RimL family protein N-acetyltransferase